MESGFRTKSSLLTRLKTIAFELKDQDLRVEDVQMNVGSLTEPLVCVWSVGERPLFMISLSFTTSMAQLRGPPPNILELIGNLITTVSDIKSLILTSRWCNNQFRYLLWRQVGVTSIDHIQFSTSLKTRTRAIRSLRFENKVAQKFYDLHLPGLQTFRQDFPDRLSEFDTVKARACLLSFIRRHGTSLQDLTITTGHLHLNREFWRRVFTTLHTARRLKIKETGSGQGIKSFEGATGNAFWRALTRFEEIEYKGKDQSGTPGPKDLDYSRLQRLTYILKGSMKNNSGFWEWLSRCSNLRRLHLQGGMTISEVISTAQQQWPLLEDLSLKGVQGLDEQSAALFQHLQPLKYLALAGGAFGSECFVQVRARHFESLKTLALRECEHFDSRLALLALIHCPHLEIFEARRIAVQDIWSFPQSWACRGLRRLLVTFESDPKYRGADMLFFEQL
ncbi:hypothetical protein BGX24_007818, partial [Mortierella sp. AD032]